MIKLALCQEIPPEEIERYYDLNIYTAERKYNGVRAIICFNKLGDDSNNTVLNRNGIDISENVPEIIRAMDGNKSVPVNTILDGELVCHTDNTWNTEAFGDILTRTKSLPTEKDLKEKPVYFRAFDMPYFGGFKQDNRYNNEQNYRKRKAKIEGIIKKSDINLLSVNSLDNIRSAWVDCVKHGWEGLVLKRKDRGYIGARTWDWIKVKPYYEMIVKIYGYEKKDSQHNDFKSLYMANPNKVTETGLGQCGQGFNESTYAMMNAFLKGRKERDFDMWVAVKPFEIKVKHYGYANSGHLKNAIFKEIVE